MRQMLHFPMRLRINIIFLFVALSCSGSTVTQNPAWWGASHPSLLDGLVSYWKLDEASGTRFDSWGTNTLTDVNTTPSSNGVFNLSASFVVSNKRLTSAMTNWLTSSFSFSWWQYNTRAFNSGTVVASMSDLTGGSLAQFGFQKFSDGNIYAGVGPVSGYDGRIVIAANASNWPQNQWIHYCLVLNFEGLAKFYTNGVFCAQNTGKTNRTYNAGIFLIGSYPGVQGEIVDEFLISRKALSTNEIQTLYNEGKSRRFPFNSGP